MFICIQVCSRRVLTISLHVHRLWISLLIECIPSCHHCFKMSSSSLEKNRFPSVDLTCWADQLTTAFTILNCLEYEFLKGFLVQERQQSVWKFSILSNILKLPWCLPNKRKIHSQLPAKFTCRDGKCGKLSSHASRMLYKEPLDQSDCWRLFVQLWNYTKM